MIKLLSLYCSSWSKIFFKPVVSFFSAFVLITILLFGHSLSAQEKPFAEHHVLLQISSADHKKQSLVLDIANNLIKHYESPDLVDIEIVAFGPGVKLLFENNQNKSRIESLMHSGINFTVCNNTIETLNRKRKTKIKLIKNIHFVQTGVAHIMEQVKKGFVHITP